MAGADASWGLQTLTLSIPTIARQCAPAGQLAAIQTNFVDDLLHHAWGLAWQARPGQWPLGRLPWTRRRERLAVAYVRRRHWESGCHEPHGATIRRWLVGDGLMLHV